MGITGWATGEAEAAAEGCFHAWLSRRGTHGAMDIESGVRAVRLFLSLHGSARVEDRCAFDNRRAIGKVFNRAGVKTEREFRIFPEVFRAEICQGFDADLVARALSERGLLKRDGRHLTVRRGSGEKTRSYLRRKSGDLENIDVGDGGGILAVEHTHTHHTPIYRRGHAKRTLKLEKRKIKKLKRENLMLSLPRRCVVCGVCVGIRRPPAAGTSPMRVSAH